MTEKRDASAGLARLPEVEPLLWREFAGLLDGVDGLLLGVSAEGRIDCFNQAVERLTGYSPEELEGLPVDHMLTAAADYPMVPEALWALRHTSDPMQFECSLRTKGGAFRVIRFSGTVTQKPSGTSQLLLVGTDTTPYREALGRLRRASAVLQACDLPEPRLAPASNVANQVPRGAEIDRRRTARHWYPYEQSIAPIAGHRLPSREAFRVVRCHDISSRGFSFLATEPPGYEKLVAALGSPEAATYVVAQLIHVSPTEYHGKQRYQVGCQYIGRACYHRPAGGSEGSDRDSPRSANEAG